MEKKKLYMISGEASGDLHGSNLVKALLNQNPELDIHAWGGERMEKAGATIVKHYKDLAFMGFTEVLLNLRTILKNISWCKKDIEAFKPDALILIDYPGFNLRIAKWAHDKGLKVFYYISPQIWAWKKKRIFKIKDTVDKMVVILPFEKEYYKKNGVEVEYYGHPLVDEVNDFKKTAISLPVFIEKNKLSDKPIIALIPGSREQEIKRMLPKMLSVVSNFPDNQFVIGAATSIPDKYYNQFLKDSSVPLLREQTYDLFNLSVAGLVTSGTATLEAGLFDMPQVVCYMGGAISIAIAKKVANVKYISLVNLILDREIVTELIQSDLTKDNMIKDLSRLLDPDYQKIISQNYSELHTVLGESETSAKVARSMLKTLYG